MSRLEKPLAHRIHPLTGDLLLRAELDLFLKDNSGNWQKETFRVDSASEITSMPAWRAKLFGLPMPQRAVTIPVNTSFGQAQTTVRSGYLRCKVDGLDPMEYAFPCFFTGDPDQSPDPNAPPATIPRSLLGLSGVVDKLRITYDGMPVSATAPYGLLIVEKI